MKLSSTICLASVLALAAGCAHDRTSSQYGETMPTYGNSHLGQTGYNPETSIGSPAAGSLYSGDVSQRTESRSDNSIVAQVRETLQRDPEIAFVVPNIQITANNGAVLLNGSVQSEEQKRQIFDKVLHVTGVVAVNNQLKVFSGANGEGASGSELNPTGNSGADRLYKDASGQDTSTNNLLNPTSRENGPSQLYHDGSQEPNSNSADQPQSGIQTGVTTESTQQNGLSSGDAGNLNATSRTNETNRFYQNQNGQGTDTSTNSIAPTSRPNSSSQIYQGPAGDKSQDWDANNKTNSNNTEPMP